ncbi:FMRFamide receptor-like [Mytilus edulis]|uniref:FMRFamide receptor-like n=1 Tax=Mytilus edulis TaxID=6550 RepID=UPI0039F0C295
MGVHEINFALNLSYNNGEYLQDSCNTSVCWDAIYLQYVFNGILLPILAVVGILGNALTMVVLWRREMHSSTIILMRGLVVTDTGIIIVACVAMTPYTLAFYHPELRYFKNVIYPNIYMPCTFLVMSIQQCNVWITVATSVERYVSICHPFKASKWISKKKTKISLAIITIVSIIYNIPRCLAFKTKTPCVEGQSSGECFVLMTTEFGGSDFYHFYQLYLYTFLIYVIPLCSLLVLNLLIINELMRMRRRRAGMNIQEDNEANLSLVLVLIVVVFLLCQTPGLLAQFDTLFDPTVMIKYLAVSNFLFVTNSSVNFLIYTAVGRKFRKNLMKFFSRVFRGSSFSEISRSSQSRRGTVGGYELNNTTYTAVSEETQIENLEKMRLKD